MFNKKYLILSIFLLSLLTLSVVSASDNATEFISLKESNDAISIEESQAMGQSEDDTLMEPDGGTFSDLQRKIDNANASSTITLENNYTYDDGFNKEGILISKEITIEGNGFTIDANKTSRIFNVTSSGVVFKNIIFINGHAEGNGGAISGSATAIGCTFNKNYANGDGGAICNVNAEGCTFSGNCAEYRGGGIYNGNATDCTFTDNNYAGQAGGGMHTGDALNCIFTGNGAKDQGAAMYGGNAVGCTFENNKADNHGAAISNGNAVNCNFTGNQVNHNGGGIYNGNATDCNFKGNEAFRGGGIYNGIATNCMFVKNVVRETDDDDGDGGAMFGGAAYYCTFDTNYAHDDGDGAALSHSYAENCIFIKNHAADCGGAIYYTSAVNCTFTENSASGEGGAIYQGDATNCTFERNILDGDGEDGGAIRYGNAYNCNFTGNKAYHGGAMHSGYAENCTFIANSADGGGAGRYLDAKNCVFINCSSSNDGGAIHVGDVENCIFTGNHASDCGGAIYKGNATNCTFEENSADNGGAMHAGGENCKAQYCTFKYNEALDDSNWDETGGGATFDMNVYHSYFESNYAKGFGGAIHGGYAENCTFVGNDAKQQGSISAKSKRVLCKTKIASSYYDYETEIPVGHITVDSEGKTEFNKRDNLTIMLSIDQQNYNGYELYVHATGPNNYDKTFYTLSSYDWMVNLTRSGKYHIEIGAVDIPEVEVYSMNITFYSIVNMTTYDISTTYGEDESYVITLRDDFNNPICNVTVNVDLNIVKDYTTDENGQINISIKDLKPGTYNAKATFDNINYDRTIKISTIFIDKQAVTLMPNTLVTTYNSNDVVIISLYDNKNKPIKNITLSADLNGTKNYTTDKQGQIEISPKGLIPDTYLIDVVFEGNEIYHNSKSTGKVIIQKDFTKLIASTMIATYNDGKELTITLTDGFDNPIREASIFVDLDGSKEYTTDKNGQIKISHEDLTPDTYELNVTFKGNDLYKESKTVTTIVINKIGTSINADSLTREYIFAKDYVIIINDENGNPAENVSIVLDLNGTKEFTTDKNGQIKFNIPENDKTMIISINDDLGNPLKNVKLSVNINGTNKYTTDSKGQIKLSTAAFAPGTYPVEVAFGGNEIYSESNASAKLTVVKCTTQLTANSVSTKYGENNDLIIILKDNLGNPINDVQVSVDLNGVKNYTTDKNGQINISTSKLAPGTYTAKIHFGEDDYCFGYDMETIVEVKKIATQIIASSVETTYNSGIFSIVCLKDIDGRPITNATLSVDLDGVENYTTDENGEIIVSTYGLTPGNHTVMIEFSENDYYIGSSNEIYISIEKSETTLTADAVETDYGINKNLIITLKDSNNLPMTNASVSVDLNGIKNYTTNQNGQITIPIQNITAGKYTAKISFEAKYYIASTIETSVVINKIESKLTANSIATTYGINENLIIKLTDNNDNPITNATVSVDLDGIKNYTTNQNGEIILSTYGLTPGNHTVKIEFSENNYYTGSNNEIYINIEKSETTLTADAVETDYGINKNLIITLKDSNNLPMTNASVSVDLNGIKNYTTNQNGQITIPIQNITPGKYVAKISFEAKYYIASTIETAVVINKIESKLTANSIATTYGINENLIIKLTDSDNHPITNATVSVELDSVKKYTTDENGQIKIPSNSITPGRYIAKISFKDKYYIDSTIETAVVVNKIASKLTSNNVTTTYNVNKKLIISLTDGDGNPIQNISVSVDLGGVKDYTTDEKGQINIPVQKLVPKTYVTKIKFNGNSHYVGSETADVVIVKKATPKIGAKAKTFKVKTKTKKYAITLKNNKKLAIKNTKVYLKVKGKTYIAKTNSKGKATFKITKLTKKGKFNAVITYKGNKYYKKATKKTKITIM